MKRAIGTFDQLVVAVLVVLVGVIAAGILRGDHVGVRIGRAGPIEEARASSVVTMQFSEEMDRSSVAEHFRIDPPVPGDIEWSGHTMTFRPSRPLDPGVSYTVALDSGARGQSARAVLDQRRFSFTVLGPRLAYLAPVDGPTKNIWAVDPADPSTSRQITHSSTGVLTYDVSPDGRQIAFAQGNRARGADIELLDLDSGETRALTSCGNSLCTDPVWSPDGSRVAFSRQASAISAIPGVPRDDTRVWLVDPTASPPKAAPLFSDPQVRAHYNPRWSPDGTWIAVSQPTGVSNGSAGVLLYNFATGARQFFSTTGPAGAFSPDGGSFFFPALAIQEGEVRNVLERADLSTMETEVVSPPTVRMNPVQLEWPAWGDDLMVAQRDGAADGGLGHQLFAIDPASGATQPLVAEPNFDHQSFTWKPDGSLVAMERAQILAASPGDDVRAQVWVYDAETGDLTRVAASAFRPHWLP